MSATYLAAMLGSILGYFGAVDLARGQRIWDALVHAHRGHVGSRGMLGIGPIHLDLSDARLLNAIAEILDLSNSYRDFLGRCGAGGCGR